MMKYVYRQVSRHVRVAQSCRRQVLSPCISSTFWDGSALHGYKCTSDICLRTCRGHSSRWSEVHVCRGLSPHPRETSADFFHTYLPVKYFIPLITGQWLYQQTASGVFLHAFYTDSMNNCISTFWCIIFNVLAPKLVIQLGFFFSLIFLDNCFVLILFTWISCYLLLLY